MRKFVMVGVAAVLALMLMSAIVSTAGAAAVETNVAVLAMSDQQAAMTVANPDQIPRFAGIASLVTPTLEDTRVLGAVLVLGILVAFGGFVLNQRRLLTWAFGFRDTWGRNGKTGQVTIRAVRSIRSLLLTAATTFTAHTNARSLTATMTAVAALTFLGSAGFTQLLL